MYLITFYFIIRLWTVRNFSNIIYKSIGSMALHPELLLSKVARARCVGNLKEQPAFMFKKTNNMKLASVLVPLCVVDEEVCLLYTLRSINLSTHKGQVAFPGGKRDENESVFDTALRETEEEIGFPRENVDVWAEMNPFQGRDRTIMITPIVGQLKDYNKNQIKINSDEVEEFFTVPMKALCDQNNHAHCMFRNIPLPIYLFGKHKIWGITGMITHFFLLSFLPSEVYNPDFMRKAYKIDDLLSPSKL